MPVIQNKVLGVMYIGTYVVHSMTIYNNDVYDSISNRINNNDHCYQDHHYDLNQVNNFPWP